MYQNILVAIDGSPTSDLTLHEALRIAKDGSRVKAITIIDNPLAGYGTPAMTSHYENIRNICLQEGQNVLSKAVIDAKNLGHIEIETQLIDLGDEAEHDIATAILHAAKEYQADLILIGRHGKKNSVKRFFMGSVAERVIRQSLTPVMIISSLSKTNQSDIGA